MSKTKNRIVLVALFLAAIAAVGIGLSVYESPHSMRSARADDADEAAAAREQLAKAADMSKAFQYTASAMRPSVVSIASVKKFKTQGVRSPQTQIPDELRKFFGDEDPFERFFQFPSEPREFQQQGLGSGVVISSDGYIMTNNHVVSGADEIEVFLHNGESYSGKIIGGDKATDVAVVKIDAQGLVPAPLGDSDKIEVGQWVLAIGSPMGLNLQQTVTAGIISAKGRANVGITEYEDFVQTDAAINPGNSGGPLVNLHGEVIGINTAIASRTGFNMGIGFAIPVNMAKVIKDSLIKHGKVERGYLGVAIQDLNEDLAQSFGVSADAGVLVGDVTPGGPADKAGIKSGDIITAINGKPMNKVSQVRNTVATTEPGSTVDVDILREKQSHKMRITLGRLDEAPEIARSPGARGGQPEVDEEFGMALQTVTPELAEQAGIDAKTHGVLVTDVEQGSLASRAGLRKGDVIIVVDGKTIQSLDDFHKAIKELDPQRGVRMQILREGLKLYVYMKTGR